ncbi:hypothetical protein [Brevundimonas goettingensis]|uniref:Uncharacterized protein n=1 Tax=Brevundimonas goettingensis TaxID=2774190 RepID=A0A975GXP0_9CAUL|nr:hypothetical protein [Brevundimonas goettingensis]QTC93084.1 hypothetical protein IFJ75_09705 [Brevundimonas goettingensis]
MAPFLVILGLLLLGVAIVAWHTRETWWHFVAHLLPQPPLTRAGKAAAMAEEPAYPAEPDAFAQAPLSRSFFAEQAAARPPAPASPNDPFAHAPSVSDLSDAGLSQSETRH